MIEDFILKVFIQQISTFSSVRVLRRKDLGLSNATPYFS